MFQNEPKMLNYPRRDGSTTRQNAIIYMDKIANKLRYSMYISSTVNDMFIYKK